MANPKPVYILGGGMSALSAAHELSKTPELQKQYRVTVLQRGWRLGGKCASSRAPHPADPYSSLRIQEHGLHVWFGFYMNAFQLMRDCYGQLGRRGLDIPGMFERRSSTPMMEFHGGRWVHWPLNFVEGAPGEEPGQVDSVPTLAEVVERIFHLVSRNLRSLRERLRGTDSPTLANPLLWLDALLASPIWRVETLRELVGAADDWRTRVARLFLGRPVEETLVSPEILALVQQLSVTDAFLPGWGQLREALDAVGPAAPDLQDELRRLWIMADLAAATLRGLAAATPELLDEGFDALDEADLREWLRTHGASAESVSSTPIRALYDLCFAYADGDSSSFATADFAAGVALRCAIRIAFGYRGAVCYALKRGMGEAVIAPLYELLRKNGVEFEFFHCVRGLQLNVDGEVTGIRFRRQAAVIGHARYHPTLQLPDGSDYWPDRPLFDQLVDGAALRAREDIDFESDLSPDWDGGKDEILSLADAEGRLAKVVLAISAGGFAQNGMTAELAAASTRWATMLAAVSTVGTQSAQVWSTLDLAGLGYRDPGDPPAMICAPEPMDVWADMSSVLASENWSPGLKPRSVQYVCGPLAGAFASTVDARAAVRTTTLRWLDTMTTGAWPHTGTTGGAGRPGRFDPDTLVAGAGRGDAAIDDQWLRANFEGSDRYVLSRSGSIAARLRADALPAGNLYLCGDWTSNGLNAGCVEAAVMSGIQAARSIRGLDPEDIPGFGDNP